MKTPTDSHYYRQVQPLDAASEDQAVRLLLLGNCQECALFEAPADRDDQAFFSRVMETILAMANSFGGWLIFGITNDWLGGVKEVGSAPLSLQQLETDRFPGLGEELRKKLSRALRPLPVEAIIGAPRESALGRWLTATQLSYVTYSPEWNRSRFESVERLLRGAEPPFLTTFSLAAPGGGALPVIRVLPLVQGELRHEQIKNGQAVVRVGRRNETRANLIGINWAVFQALRLPEPWNQDHDERKKRRVNEYPEKTQLERFMPGDPSASLPHRVETRSQVCEFLNCLNPLRRIDLALDLTGRCWQQLEMRDLFETTLKSLYATELGGRHLNERFWRDHVVHQFYVFLLGIYLWNSCRPLRERLEQEESATTTWAMTATCHDLGYPFEMLIVNLMDELKGLVPVKVNHSAIFPRIKDLACSDPGQDYWRLISEELWPGKSCSPAGQTSTTVPSPLEAIFDAKSLNPQANLLDHGMVSALLWLNLYRQASAAKPAHFPKWVMQAAGAIAAHNLSYSDLEKVMQPPKGSNIMKEFGFRLETHPLVILLALCDTFQEWDRTAVSRHVLIPGAVQVEILLSRRWSKKRQEESTREQEVWKIAARFGLDSRVAEKITAAFNSDRKIFNLGEDLSVQSESFFAAVSSLNDARMVTATEDPWMAEGGAKTPTFLTEIEFAPFGTVLQQPHYGMVYLDTGNQVMPGIIDNHARLGPASTALLVFENPHLVREHVGHLPLKEVILVTHQQPDMDAITAAFFCQEILVRGCLPPSWKPLAEYVSLADSNLLPIGWDFPSTPWGIFKYFIRTAPGRDLLKVRRGFMVLRYLTRWLEETRTNPDADPKTCFEKAFSGPHPFERVQVDAGKDYDIFRKIIDDGLARELPLKIPIYPFQIDQDGQLALKEVKVFISGPFGGKEGYPVFAEHWAALEGYGGTVFHKGRAEDTKKGWKPGRTTLATTSAEGSDQRPTLWGLGHLLDEKETLVRQRRTGP